MTLRGALLLALVAAAAVALMPLQANATTEAEKMLDITQALTYLANQQQADGRWAYGGVYTDVAATGSALLAFQEAPVAARPANYNAIVSSGLTYLFQQARTVNIGGQPWGNPDSTGNGIGVYFNHINTLGNHDTYPTGMAIPAIVASGTPGAIVNAPGSAVNGWTYQQVVQETADYLAWGQNDGGWERGGWGYAANNVGWSDNSNAQWPAVGLLYAQPWQTAAQKAQLQFVKTELDKWINTIQFRGALPNDGASDYVPGYNWRNPVKTGGLLVQMDYSQGQPPADVNAAVAYLNRAWLNGGFEAYAGNFGDAYAMWGVYKGLEVTIGLNDTTNITNLNNQLTARFGGPAPLDAGDNWTWWEDYCEYLHNTQLGDGSWASGGFVGGGPLAAAWYTNILNATQIPPPVIPEPVTMIGMLAGIGGLVGYVRRRRLA